MTAVQSFIVRDTGTFLLSAAALAVIAYLGMQLCLPSSLEKTLGFVRNQTFWVLLCVLVLGGYLMLLVLNTSYAGYLEHVEPNIASVSFIFLQGAPLYHDLSSPQRYSFPYGPMAYVPYALALRVFGANILSLKLVVLLANLCLLGLLWGSYRKLLDPLGALLVTTVVLIFFLLYDYLFQVRGDVLVILLVALGLYAVLVMPARLSALVLALACAFAFDVKFTALFYFCPLVAILFRRAGWQPTALAVTGAALLAAIPFLYPNISLTAYLDWLHRTSRQSLSRMELFRELKLLPVILAPVSLLLWHMGRKSQGCLAAYLRENRYFLLVLGACLSIVGVSSSKLGAGPHHFMPFYPILGYVCADIFSMSKGLALAKPATTSWDYMPLFWCWLSIAVITQMGIALLPTVSTLARSRRQAAAVAADLDAVMKGYPGKKIEMGYGGWNSGYRLTYFRPALVFAGNPLTIDAVALGDMQFSGVAIPPSTLEYLDECKTQIWLIPKDDPPFSMVNVYSLMDPNHFSKRTLFSDEFRRIFFRRYGKQGSTEYFDIWRCEPESCSDSPECSGLTYTVVDTLAAPST